MSLTLSVRGAARGALPEAERRQLKRRLQRAMAAAGAAEAEVSLSLSDDAELWELNRAYAGEDHATDVLSFSQRESALAPGAALRPGAAPRPGELLGDIIISIETARRQAATAGHELGDELLHLSVHGLCHLLGYDHGSPEEERVMFGYEALLRAEARRAGAARPVPPP